MADLIETEDGWLIDGEDENGALHERLAEAVALLQFDEEVDCYWLFRSVEVEWKEGDREILAMILRFDDSEDDECDVHVSTYANVADAEREWERLKEEAEIEDEEDDDEGDDAGDEEGDD